MSRRTKAVRRIRQCKTLADLLRFVASGAMTADEAEELIDAVEVGEGLKERDLALAKIMNAAPPSIDKDPVFAAGVSAGFEYAQRMAADGQDITKLERIRGTWEVTKESVAAEKGN